MRYLHSALLFALLLLAACGAADAPAVSSTAQPAPATAPPAAQAATPAPTATPEPSAAPKPTAAARATAPAGDQPSDANGAGSPCGAQSNATPTPTPPERNDLDEPTDPCATAEIQPSGGGAAQPCPGGPPDDHPPALPQPTQPGAAPCPTAQPVGVTVVAAEGGASPTPLQGQRTIGLPSQKTTVELAVGETFELKLGGGMDWTVQIDDGGVVAREPGNVTPDSQGVYRTLATGSTTLRASGDPTCRKASPPCAAPSFLFEITIVVR